MNSYLLKTFIFVSLHCIAIPSTAFLQKIYPVMQQPSDSSEEQTRDDPERFETYLYLVHYYEQFKDPYKLNWHLTSLQAKLKSKQITYMGYLNYGQRFYETTGFFEKLDLQYRFDVYPMLGEHNYAYLSYGYSESHLFPTHQARGVLYHQFGKGFETSLGLYYMKWEKTFLIYTGSFAKYYQDYWFSLRPYFQFHNGTLYQSYLFFARRYFETPDDFLNLMLGYGSSPEDQALLFDYNEIYSLESYHVQVNLQQSIDQWIIIAGLGFRFEEYSEQEFRNRLRMELGVSYKF